MKIYNTLTRKKEEFAPLHPGKVGMYVCGPTVYNHIHVGNARTAVSFDVIRRHFINSGYEVTFVSNLTDVDDKIIKRANEEGRTAAQVAEEYSQAYIDVMDRLNVMPPTIRPRATQEIDAMIATISKLIEKGHAYEAAGDVYFAVRTDSHYGVLSGRDIDDMVSGARVDVDPNKRDPLDFALWKAAKPGEPSWESPWGSGRPGWHIECSSMSAKYLGQPFDIHGGGADLIFPHHENEIAQAEGAEGERFCTYWMHGGMLLIDSEKMSKSLGNFTLLKDALEAIDPRVLRFLMLQTHYRSPMDYSPARLEEAQAGFERIANAIANADWAIQNAGDGHDEATEGACAELAATVAACMSAYVEAMDDDFNTAAALGAVFTLVGALNAFIADGVSRGQMADAAQGARDAVVGLMARFGIDMLADNGGGEDEDWPQGVLDLAAEMTGYDGSDKLAAAQGLLDARAAARAAKDYARADAIRDGLAGLGFTIEDTPQGARIKW